jgi:hypothetical protein
MSAGSIWAVIRSEGAVAAHCRDPVVGEVEGDAVEILGAFLCWGVSRLPRMRLVVFENSAHMTFAEENDRYLATVRQFLDRITN